MRAVILVALLGTVGCKKEAQQDNSKVTSGPGVAAKAAPQVDAPFDLKNPPGDAVKTASGLIYKPIKPNPTGPLPKRNDTVMVKYTGWRQASGETFFSNINSESPMPLNLAKAAKGFTEGMQLVHKGEKAMFWVPAAIGYEDGKPPPANPETLVYEVEVVDIKEAPAVPADVKGPPPDALSTKKSGTKYVVVRQGTGKDAAHIADEVTFHYTVWDAEGKMIETTEMKKQPARSTPYKQAVAFEEILEQMVPGERVRAWVDAAALKEQVKTVVTGPVVIEVEVLQIDKAKGDPPPSPPDVAKPPGDARKTAKGVFYKVLKAGKGGDKPKPTDTVRVHYTGWQTDGRMFDSSVIRGEPSEFSLQGVIAGWTDGLQQMSVGDRFRFWIPDDLAYKGQQGRPQGMLVFDIELLEIKPAAPHADMPPGHH
ncbi:MAG TPA: FKBP-type peptidyl-prolyl cis-trans isomerase [Kofleriaceae bacterium]|nr:FKBP-type peptidyl-prolyl cis-trans isomerase [Kofleriaceae bacterium]